MEGIISKFNGEFQDDRVISAKSTVDDIEKTLFVRSRYPNTSGKAR